MKKLNPLISDDSINTILEIASAYQKSRTLLTACELDIFTILGNDLKSAKEVAIESKTDERAIDRIMAALCSMHLLNKTGYKYSNTKGTRRFLVKDRPEYIGNMTHLSHLWDRWETLTECAITGKAVIYKSINEKSDQWVKSYVDSMHWRSIMQAPDIVKLLNLHDIRSVLDLGCGSGVYTIEMLKFKPNLEVALFDFPKVIMHAKTHIEQAGLIDKVQFLEGDCFTDSIGKGYDAVFVSNLLHYYSVKENVDLMVKIYNSLNPKGVVIIQDIIVDDDRTSPQAASIMSLNMLVNTLSGDVYTESDLWMILREAWFSNIKRTSTAFGSSIVIAYK